MTNTDPAIDQICDTLKCTPGQAPERVRELVEIVSRLNGSPPDKPPDNDRLVLLLLEDEIYDFGCFDDDGWQYFDDDGWQYKEKEEIIAWYEMPPVPGMEQEND